MNNPKTDIKEVNEFFYIDFKKYVYKNRKQINQKLKGLSYRKKVEFLELLWKKQVGKGFGKDADGRDIHYKLKSDKVIKEGLKELGITDFKSLFKKMPPQLQKRVYNLKNFGQRLDKHSEGNVLKHTIMVVNRSIKEDDIDIAIAAMFHDIGKDETAGIHPKKGHITHFGHEKVSASLVKKYKKFIESVGGNPANVFYIVKNHMRYKQLSVMTPKKVNKVKSFRAFDKLGKFSKHDRGGLDENKATRTKFSLTVPSDIKKLQQAFKKNKKQLYVVGGAVRDALLGKKPKDFDLTTDATPDGTKGAPTAVAPGKTGVGKQTDGVGVSKANGPADSEGRGDLDSVEQDADSNDTIRDRKAGKKPTQTMRGVGAATKGIKFFG